MVKFISTSSKLFTSLRQAPEWYSKALPKTTSVLVDRVRQHSRQPHDNTHDSLTTTLTTTSHCLKIGVWFQMRKIDLPKLIFFSFRFVVYSFLHQKILNSGKVSYQKYFILIFFLYSRVAFFYPSNGCKEKYLTLFLDKKMY